MLKVGVFGVSHLGKFHLNNWKEIKDIELVGFYDPDDVAAQEVTEKYQLRKVSRPRTPYRGQWIWWILWRLLLTISIFVSWLSVRGKHVFVEKPLANTMEEARGLVKLVRESNIKLQVGHVERFSPAYLGIQHMQLHPMFIEVHRLAQFNPRGTEVSDTRPHDT